MSIKDQITADFKQAYKDRNQVSKDILSFVLAQIKQKEIDTRQDLTDDEVIAILKKETKALTEAIGYLVQAEKFDDKAYEEQKIQVLQAYLPAQLDAAQTKALVQQVMSQNAIADISKEKGKLMGILMKDHKSVIDSQTLQEVLAGL